MRNSFLVAVVIPALNEAEALPCVLNRIPSWADEIIVMDNGSTDGTADIASAAGATVVHEPKRGYGRACLAGIHAAANAEIIVFLDADGSDDPRLMERLIDPITDGLADLVIGSRRLGHAVPGAMSIPQRFGNWLAPALIQLLWKERCTDLGPFRAIRQSALAQLRMDDESYGWTIQMQIRAARFRLRTIEVPVEYARRCAGQSKISGTLAGVVGAARKILSCIARERLAPPVLAPWRLERLAVFTKFPEPGSVKTRLISTLGAQGAADLHTRLVHHTLAQVRRFTDRRDVLAEIWLGNGHVHRFESMFNSTLSCREQHGDDLGERMHAAFKAMLSDASAAVIIGTDCPQLTPAILSQAFDALRSHDAVFGPATDGGYYLVGLRRPAAGLFAGIRWSTATVLAETLERARSLGFKTACLERLSDVDVPADLSMAEQAGLNVSFHVDTPILSVIIPTLNEAAVIAQTIQCIARPGVEIIVADGGSTDRTRRIAAECGARVLITSPGRGCQLNAGAGVARAPRLLFLHADTALPNNFLSIIFRVLDREEGTIGAFRFRVDEPGLLLRLIEAAVRLRCALFKTPYGDQALFMQTTAFDELRGFAPIPIMEDLDFIRRTKARFGRESIVTAPVAAVTSGRRWVDAGVLRMTIVNQACIVGHALGIDPGRLAAWRNRRTGKPRHSDAQIDPLGSPAPNAARTVLIAGCDAEATK